MISVSNVTYHAEGTLILDDVSLTVPKGGVTALVGPNGAGKSTLLSLMARLIPMQSGYIQIDDLVIGQCATDQLAKRLSILPQTGEAAPRLTVRDLIGFGRYPYHKGRPSEQDHLRVSEALKEFQLETLSERSLDTLSGGQRQRALVAMTFVQDTDYMLLDEPLNNLDIAASRSLMALLRELAQNHNRTIVIVLHDINYACSYADNIVTMRAGKIGAIGAPSEIVTSTMLSDVFDTIADVHTINDQPVVLV